MRKIVLTFVMAFALPLLIPGFTTSLPASSCKLDSAMWKKSIEGNTRFIPVELWTGTSWDGTNKFNWPTVDAEYRHLDIAGSKNYRIVGPFKWEQADAAGFMFYERTNPAVKDGQSLKEEKLQLFTINKEKTGLGRVYDSRANRKFSAGLKFPLGYWTAGKKNSKSVKFHQYNGLKPQLREERIAMTEIDYVFTTGKEKYPHCIKFEWEVVPLSQEKGTLPGSEKGESHNYYVYCPCKRMVQDTPIH